MNFNETRYNSIQTIYPFLDPGYAESLESSPLKNLAAQRAK